MARKVSCAAPDANEKTIAFKPFVVDMLEVVSVPVSSGSVDCWMDIRRGSFPNVSVNLFSIHYEKCRCTYVL